MRKLITGTLLLTLLCVISIEAKTERIKVFAFPRDEVFSATLRAVNKHMSVAGSDRVSGLIVTAPSGAWFKGLTFGIQIEAIDTTHTRVTLIGRKQTGVAFAWGRGGPEAEKLFRWISEELISK